MQKVLLFLLNIIILFLGLQGYVFKNKSLAIEELLIKQETIMQKNQNDIKKIQNKNNKHQFNVNQIMKTITALALEYGLQVEILVVENQVDLQQVNIRSELLANFIDSLNFLDQLEQKEIFIKQVKVIALDNQNFEIKLELII